MSTEPPIVDESPAVECFAECEYFEDVTGKCTHESTQALVKQFVESPESTCPVFTESDAE